MAKKLVRYLLEGDGSIPVFVEKGGNFPIGGEMIGRSVDENERHVPNTVVRMTKADLLARLNSMDLKDHDGVSLTEEQIADLADAYLADIELSDLA